MVVVEKLDKSYGKKTILHKVSFHFHGGHIYGLVGINGSGKTTLMRCICGFVKPDSGTVRVKDKLIGTDCDFAPDTGAIIETPAFLPYYSARKNMQILAAISKKVDKNRVDLVIRELGLDPDDKKPVGQYSLGMRQRLGIAQAIMENPDLLILDEPFNGLDTAGNADIHHLLQQLKNKGKCIILASHSRHDIETACDTICILNNGKLVNSDGD